MSPLIEEARRRQRRRRIALVAAVVALVAGGGASYTEVGGRQAPKPTTQPQTGPQVMIDGQSAKFRIWRWRDGSLTMRVVRTH